MSAHRYGELAADLNNSFLMKFKPSSGAISPGVHPVRVLFLGIASVDPPILHFPMAAVHVKLGFPSPAEDFLDDRMDLNNLQVRNPPATFLYRAQ